MKPETRLDSAIFQLTPTRTRCDLFIISGKKKKKEKVASGLLSPFLAHLKSAQEQIAKGGYSITLQPDPDNDAEWFTKWTVERFVRFVSTPDILERVNTIELEILQIEEAMDIQGNDSLGLKTVELHQKRLVENKEGSKPTTDSDSDKAIVLYKPGDDPPQTTCSDVESENSKVQLMRVLETRRTVLQKEQGMAFARAVAAGFDVDHLSHLVSFSECFGAARLLVACVKFMELWKRKHETGQWLEVETAEALCMHPELSPLHVSGVLHSGANTDGSIEVNGKDVNDDKRAPGNPQVPLFPHDYPHGQFQHPMFPQWSMHSPPGGTVFQSYPLQGMPYYAGYPASSPCFQSPSNQLEDPRFNTQRRLKKKKHSLDSNESKESSGDSDAEETGNFTAGSADGAEAEVKSSYKKTPRSGKKRSGVVVIRNINYITSKKHSASGSEHESDSTTEMEEETDNSRRHGKRSSKNKAGQTPSSEILNSNQDIQGENPDSENWKVFQSFLLRNEENRSSSDVAMFSNEKGSLAKQRQPNSGMDSVLPYDGDSACNSDNRFLRFESVDGRVIYKSRQMAPDARLISSTGQKMARENQGNVELQEIEGGRAAYRYGSSDDFVIYGRDNQPNRTNSLDPLAGSGVNFTAHTGGDPQTKIGDESFLVPLRSHSQDSSATSRGVIYADSVVKANSQGAEGSNDKRNQACYEPNDLCLMSERIADGELSGHDSAIYCDLAMHANKIVKSTGIQRVTSRSVKNGKNSDKLKKTQASQSVHDGNARKARPSRLNPLAEAQARAGKLRAFKADLQKTKKEKEEEELKRLEALKSERQRRIAARGSSSVQQGTTSMQTRSQIPKVFPNLNRGSKFSDTEPASASPLQRIPFRRASTGSSVPQKVPATGKLTTDHPSRNGLSRSVSSLPEMKKEIKSATDKKTISVTRRLSDPKRGTVQSSVKSAVTFQGPKSTTLDSKGNGSGNSLLLKSQKVDRFGKKNVSEDPPIKKISAIINLDKSKAASLPELKLRIPRARSNVEAKADSCTENYRKENLAQTPESFVGKNNMAEASQSTDRDEGLVVEKTVVMSEQERITAPNLTSQERTVTGTLFRKETKLETECKVASSLPPVAVNIPLKSPIKGPPPKQPTYEVEKPYQAPHARLSSMESITDLDHSGVLEMGTSEMVQKTSGSAQSKLSTSTGPASIDHPPELPEKPRAKEPKGFKRLLKFGKRSQNPSNEELNVDPSASSVHARAAPVASPHEVPSLKHLIAEEDVNNESTPPKASRSFSILSPFRIKSSEKKITV